MATIDSAPCKSCATRARHGLDGMCPTCANERTSGRSTLARDGVAGERLSDGEINEIVAAYEDEPAALEDALDADTIAQLAMEIQQRRAADLTPLQIEALKFAAGAIDFYGSSLGCSASSKEIQTMRDAVASIIRSHGASS